MADLQLVPIASGDGIVTRVHLASFYLHVSCSTDMDAIPTALNAQMSERGMVDEIAEEGIVGRVLDFEVLNLAVVARCQEEGVGTTHSLFAQGIANVIAVDAASGKFSRWYHNSSTASFGALVDGLVDDGSIVDVLIARFSTQRQDVDDDR